MFKRIRYLHGCIARERRSNGPDVWIFRWRETQPDGQRTNRKVVVGTKSKRLPLRIGSANYQWRPERRRSFGTS